MRHETRSITAGQYMIAFACGVAAGAVAGLMTAPRSGRETRQKLQGWASDLRHRAQRLPQAMSESVHTMAQAGKEAFNDTYTRTTPRTTS